MYKVRQSAWIRKIFIDIVMEHNVAYTRMHNTFLNYETWVTFGLKSNFGTYSVNAIVTFKLVKLSILIGKTYKYLSLLNLYVLEWYDNEKKKDARYFTYLPYMIYNDALVKC